MTVLLIVVALLIAAIVAVVVIGALLPVGHTATRSVNLPQPPEQVWATITDVDGYPSWRSGVRSVEPLPDSEGRPRWRESGARQAVTFEVVHAAPPTRWVTRIAQDGLPYGGTWTYLISPGPNGGSTLTVTEDGQVFNPVFRFVSRFVLGHTATIDRYLTALEQRR